MQFQSCTFNPISKFFVFPEFTKIGKLLKNLKYCIEVF